MRNSEGVVLWTHDVGSGLVAPKADANQGATGDGSGKNTGTDHGNGDGDSAENGEDVEVRFFPDRIALYPSDPDER